MKNDWFITNLEKLQNVDAGPTSLIKGKGFSVYSIEQNIHRFTLKDSGPEYFLILDGYILPRNEFRSLYNKMTPKELIEHLYIEHKNEFINFLKGNFIIIIGNIQSGFTIFTDHLGTRKVFYYHDPGKSKFVLSNHIKYVSALVSTELNLTGIAVQSLTHHYLGGITFLQEIYYTKPAARITFNEELYFNEYWDCSALLKLQKNNISHQKIADSFKNIMKDYIDFFKPDKIAVTLTGGLDSRTILAALLNLGCKPYTFTYGHENSPDGNIAMEISLRCGIEHHNHHISTADWFDDMAEEIVDIGKSITQLHRAHRLWAVKNEVKIHPNTQMIFGGYMGGESIRNFFYDGVIVSDFSKLWMQEDIDKKQLIRDFLSDKFIKSEHLDIDEIYEVLSSQKYFDPGENIDLKEFYMTFQLLAGIHHSQDPVLFSHYIPVPVSIYLDIDFLYSIFSTQYNFLTAKRNSGNILKRFLNRIRGAELYCHFIEVFSPELADIPFAKKGYYSALEYVKDPILLLILKRVKRSIFNRSRGPVNFKLDIWMEEFVNKGLSQIEDDNIIRSIYNIPEAVKQLKDHKHSDREKYWKKFTEIIWTDKNIKKYMDSIDPEN